MQHDEKDTGRIPAIQKGCEIITIMLNGKAYKDKRDSPEGCPVIEHLFLRCFQRRETDGDFQQLAHVRPFLAGALEIENLVLRPPKQRCTEIVLEGFDVPLAEGNVFRLYVPKAQPRRQKTFIILIGSVRDLVKLQISDAFRRAPEPDIGPVFCSLGSADDILFPVREDARPG